MKINKTLAAGIAATLAVTSLATAAGAVRSRTWPMEKTYGKIVYKPVVAGVTAIDPGDYFDFKGEEKKIPRSFQVKGGESGVDTNLDGLVNDLDFDYYIPFKVWSDDAELLNCLDKLTVVVSGKRVASNGATTENISQTVNLVPVKSATYATGTNANYILPIYNQGAPAEGCFIPERFVQVDKIDFKVSSKNSITASSLSKADYELIEKNTKNGPSWHPTLVINPDGDLDVLYKGAIEQSWDAHAAKVYIQLADAYVDADKNGYDDGNVAYKVTNVATTWEYNKAGDRLDIITGTPAGKPNVLSDGDGVNPAVEKKDGGYLLSKIRSTMATGCTIYMDANGGTFSTYDEPAWLPKTEMNGNNILERNEIWMLSDTNDYNSDSDLTPELVSEGQTYDVVDYNKGTIPRGFAGMASQIADFFNSKAGEAPKKDAKIIFTFEAFVPATGGTEWKNGGIPSTEVGLRNFLEAAQVKDFALFVNYRATTGSLQATASLDRESGSVIFDITDILKALDGRTIGTVQDLYYGLNNGITYNIGTGLWVKEIRYEYDDSAAANTDNNTAAETEKQEEKPAETKKEEKPAETKEEPSIIDDDDDDDDTTVVDDTTTPSNGGQTVVDNGNAPKNDENPHTGVALAVIPAIVAGAAVVATKKRK